MPPTDIRNPDYFHKVVDCQWACPAHTPVPEYIRLIAAGRYTDAYMVNWNSNVFPGILGRTCDRPCEPACRRGRVEDEPVAICRLKRVAADNKDDIGALPAAAPRRRRNGKRIALIGAGPGLADGGARPRAARLRDRHLSTASARGGGMIRSQIPRFRLPETVIDEEVGYIVGIGGIETRYGQRDRQPRRRCSPRATTRSSSAPARRAGATSTFPGRKEAAANIHIGIDWLSNVSFGHIEQDRPARHRARRRQHRDGLLPHLAPPRRRGREGRRPLRLRGDEGVPLGEGGRHARGHPDPQLPRAQGVHARRTAG